MSLDRRKVTMTSLTAQPDGGALRAEATDYVDVEHLDAYVAHAYANGWQAVNVGTETDHGPGGEDGEYVVHPHMEGS